MSLKHSLRYIIIISCLGTLLSLYFGYFGDPIANIIHHDLFNSTNALEPCSLCRYARIALYPITIISIIGLIYRDRMSIVYITPLSLLGLILTGYQIALQSGIVPDEGICIPGAKSCAIIDWQYFGVTIPMLACIAFVLLLAICISYIIQHKNIHKS